MYDNQMSVFSQQMDCEPKLQECNKKTDGLKQQVLTCSLSPARVVMLRARPVLSSKFPFCFRLFFICTLQIIKCAEFEGKLAAVEGRRDMDRCVDRGFGFQIER